VTKGKYPPGYGRGVNPDLDAPLPPDTAMEQRMRAGLPYRGDDPRLLALRHRTARRLRALEALDPADAAGRRVALRELLGSFGEGAEIMTPFRCEYGDHVHLGPRAFVNFGAVLLDVAEIRIGADAQLATGVQLLTATHPIDAASRRSGWEWARPIRIGDDVWLGGGVIVLPGVTVGAGTVVGAGAVVTRDLPAGVVAVGNPARVVRAIGPDDRPWGDSDVPPAEDTSADTSDGRG